MEAMISRKDAAKVLGISLAALDQARSSGLIAYIQYVEMGASILQKQHFRSILPDVRTEQNL